MITIWGIICRNWKEEKKKTRNDRDQLRVRLISYTILNWLICRYYYYVYYMKWFWLIGKRVEKIVTRTELRPHAWNCRCWLISFFFFFCAQFQFRFNGQKNYAFKGNYWISNVDDFKSRTNAHTHTHIHPWTHEHWILISKKKKSNRNIKFTNL